MQNSYVYILTNIHKTMYYIGVTNSLERRLVEHREGLGSKFTSKYNIFYLIYFEEFTDINRAIEREKQLKGWSRIKKEKLIKATNPEMVWIDV